MHYRHDDGNGDDDDDAFPIWKGKFYFVSSCFSLALQENTTFVGNG